jgi:outer membrane protein assembly factor BamD (BamD/ComL family)
MNRSMASLAAAIAAAFLLFASCSSAPKEIPEGLSAAEIVQRAQEASDVYQYDAAVRYYETLRERFGSDPTYSCTADYEIAFIAYKQERYAEARSGMEALLARYAGPGGNLLPPRYQILADKVLGVILEKTAAKK